MKMKRFLASAVIVGVLAGASLGFFAMSHSMDGVMSTNCPITSLPVAVCSSGVLSAISHFQSMYQAFTNGIVASIVTQVLAITVLFVVGMYGLQKYTISIPRLFILSRAFRAKLYRPKPLTRWLSLLVNSPSFI